MRRKLDRGGDREKKRRGGERDTRNERGRETGGPCLGLRFPGGRRGEGRGATLYPYIFNMFLYDNRVLIE